MAFAKSLYENIIFLKMSLKYFNFLTFIIFTSSVADCGIKASNERSVLNHHILLYTYYVSHIAGK